MTRSVPARFSAASDFSCSAGIAEGWATSAFRLGANRAISAAQLASSEAGATSRLGFRVIARASRFSTKQQRQHLDGLAEPHVVGEAGAEPSPVKQIEPLHARLLIGPQRGLQRFSGVHAGEPVGPAQPGQGLLRAMARPRSGPTPRRPARQRHHQPLPAPASSRMASPNDRPSSAGAALDRLELLQRAGKAIAIHLDPLAADEGRAPPTGPAAS